MADWVGTPDCRCILALHGCGLSHPLDTNCFLPQYKVGLLESWESADGIAASDP